MWPSTETPLIIYYYFSGRLNFVYNFSKIW